MIELCLSGWHTDPLWVGVCPVSVVKLSVGQTRSLHGDPQHRVEHAPRVEPTVEAEDILVQVGLKVPMTDTVMRPFDPGLQVRVDEVDHGQMALSKVGVAVEYDRVQFVAVPSKAVVALPSVSCERAPWRDVLRDKVHSLGLGSGWDHPQAQATRIELPFRWDTVLVGVSQLDFPLGAAHLDGSDHRGHLVNSTALSTGPSAKKRLIEFNRPLWADPVSVGSYHRSAKLVGQLEGRLVPPDA